MRFDRQTFVNREKSLAAFQRLLQHRQRRLFLLHGPGGIGKSYLLHRLQHLCRDEGVQAALIDLADPRLADEVQLIRHLSAALGEAFTADFARAEAAGLQEQQVTNGRSIPLPYGGGGVSVGGDAEVGGDLVGGHKIVLHNSSIVVNVTEKQDAAPALGQILHRLLRQLVVKERVVLLFDHFSKERGQQATAPVINWLRYSLLAWQQADPEGFANLWLAFAGRHPPFIEEAADWYGWAETMQIDPFQPEAIEEFWVQVRQLDATHLPAFMSASGGNPGLLFLMANNVEAASGGYLT